MNRILQFNVTQSDLNLLVFALKDKTNRRTQSVLRFGSTLRLRPNRMCAQYTLKLYE